MKLQRQGIIGLIVLVIIAVVGLALIRSESSKEKESIKLGFIGPLSGGPALWGEGAKHMTELAIEEINRAGGVDGRLLEVTYEDGKCSPKDAVTASQKLKELGIRFVIGGHCSPETTAMVPLTKDGSTFLIAGITSSDKAVSESDFAYRTSPSTYEFTDKLTSLAMNQYDYRKIAALTESASFSKSYTDDLIKVFEKSGGRVLSHEEYRQDETDFRGALLKIKAVMPDALFLSPQNPATGINILKQIVELGIQIPIFSTSILVNRTNVEKSGMLSVMKGMFTLIPYADPHTEKTEALTKKYKERFGTGVPYNYFYVSASYDAVYMVVEALDTCGENTRCVADYFKNIEYDGVSAHYRFKETGDPYFNSWAKLSLNDNLEEVVEVLK